MNKKLFVISSIVLTILLTSVTIPVTSDTTNIEPFGRTRIRAIGRDFHICEDDRGLYGHVLIGIKGFELIINEDIYIPNEHLRLLIVTNHMICGIIKE